MRGVRCPIVVGRELELALLTDGVVAADDGRGGVAFVLGEAGIGKSRLLGAAADIARSRGMPVLWGRASDSPVPVPYRPVAEAFLSAFRGRALDLERLGGLRPGLQLLLPGLVAPEGGSQPSALVVGEAAIALAELSAGRDGAVLVLEDLQWADAETCELVDYLSDKLPATSVALLASVRTGEGSQMERVANDLAARRLAEHVVLRPLEPEAVATLIGASLGTASVPPPLRAVVEDASGGVPLLVEEVLTSLVDAGALRRGPDGWHASDRLPTFVPPSLGALVTDRLRTLGEASRDVLAAASVIAERIDADVLAVVTDLDRAAVVDGLREAVRAQLVDEDGPGATPAFRFHHGLCRAAVLDGVPEGERRRLASRALDAVTEQQVGGPGDRAEIAAALALTAGDTGRAMRAFLESAAAALSAGACLSARNAAGLAVDLATSADERVAARELLLDALVATGDAVHGAAVGGELLVDLERLGSGALPVARVHLRLAEAAVATTDWPTAVRHLDAAADVAGQERGLSARMALLRAATALGRHATEEAAEHARRAMAAAQEDHDDVQVAEAAMLLGRASRVHDVAAAAGAFTAARTAADRAGSLVLRARAAHELGTLDVLDAGPADRMRAAHRLADEAGALALAAVCETHLAILHWLHFELEESRSCAARASDLARRYQLGLLVPFASTVAGSIDALLGREREAVELFERHHELMDEEIEATGRGHLLATLALALEDRARARRELDRAVELAPPHSDVARAPYNGLRALVLAVDGDERAGEVVHGLARDPAVVGVARGLVDLALAALQGRSGDRPGAATTADRGLVALRRAPWFHAMGARLVSEAAVDGGWGEPAGWLRASYDFFDGAGVTGPAEACRTLLRRAGAAVPRPHAGDEPPALARLGVTTREAEVLLLVAAGLSNRDIADRLVLSVRTVEKHVERLLTKTDTGNRTQLAALANRLTATAPDRR